MDFALGLAPFADQMFGSIAGEAMASANAYNATLQYNSAQTSFENAQYLQQNQIYNSQNLAAMHAGNLMALNNAQLTNRTELNESNQNFMAGQSQLNRDFSQNMFQQGLQGASQLQSERFEQLSNLQTSRLENMQNMQSTSIGASFARGALNFGSGLIGSLVGGAIQSGLNNQVASLQRENFDYMTNKAEDAYSASGLPTYLAFQGTGNNSYMNMMPKTTQVVNGQNSMTSQIPGNPTSTPWTGSDAQSTFGFGDVPTAS